MTAREACESAWRKSSYSADQGCVEISSARGKVMVRDSKNPNGYTLSVTVAAWQAYLAVITH